jgi:hypothetical protein
VGCKRGRNAVFGTGSTREVVHCNIGYVQHTEAIKVDIEGGMQYTSDWAVWPLR